MCQIIQVGEGTAIICNAKKDHVCNEDAGVILLADGNRVPDTEENAEKYRDQIRGGSVCCSICGSAAIDQAMWL